MSWTEVSKGSGVAETTATGREGAELRLGRCRVWDFIKRRGQMPDSESPVAVATR